jgi:GNAT superfamily N-acetyltransferase
MPLDEAIATVTRWYRARGLPPMIAVPAPVAAAAPGAVPSARLEADSPGVVFPGEAVDQDLSRRGWPVRSSPAFVMLADLPLGVPPAALPGGRTVHVTSEPDDEWAARYHYRGQDYLPPIALKVLTSAEEQSFVSIRDGDTVLAIVRLSVAGGWAGLTAVEVHPGYRRQGLGAAITAAACQRARQRGISRVFLQVEVDNVPAQALYEGLGFRRSHRYHYRVAPA